MIQNSSILQKSEVSVIVDDMDWSHWIFIVFFTNFYVLISKYIVTVQIKPGATVIHVLITTKLFIIAWLNQKIEEVHFPNVVSEVILHCIFSIWSKLQRPFQHVVFYFIEMAILWQFGTFHSEYSCAESFIIICVGLGQTNFIIFSRSHRKFLERIWIQKGHDYCQCVIMNVLKKLVSQNLSCLAYSIFFLFLKLALNCLTVLLVISDLEFSQNFF